MPKTPLMDKAYQEISASIIRYKLKPGVHLKIEELAIALGMSQTPVREALSRLEHERLVDRHPQKGYTVRTLSLQNVSDIYDVRMALEVLAVTEAATRMNEAHRRRLSVNLSEFMRLVNKGDKGQLLQVEQDFHVNIMEASGNQFLTEIMGGIFDRIWMIQNINILTSDQLIRAHKYHVEIYNALEKADPPKAAALMKKHLKFAKSYILSRLEDSGDVLANFIGSFPSGKTSQRNFDDRSGERELSKFRAANT